MNCHGSAAEQNNGYKIDKNPDSPIPEMNGNDGVVQNDQQKQNEFEPRRKFFQHESGECDACDEPQENIIPAVKIADNRQRQHDDVQNQKTAENFLAFRQLNFVFTNRLRCLLVVFFMNIDFENDTSYNKKSYNNDKADDEKCRYEIDCHLLTYN